MAKVVNLTASSALLRLSGISRLSRLECLSLCMNGLLRLPPGLEALQVGSMGAMCECETLKRVMFLGCLKSLRSC